MRPYEVVVIFDVGLEESVITRDHRPGRRARAFARWATPGHVDRWGRRTFAYELKHRTEGYYVFIEFVAEPALVAEVDRMLTL